MNSTPNKFAASSKAFGVAALLCSASVLGLPHHAVAQAHKPVRTTSTPVKEMQMVAPALEHYTQELLLGDVWQRPGLSPRDRSIVTVAVLIARNHPMELPYYLNRALDNGVKPGEIAEIITHLAFYSGWPNAVAAVNAAKPVFAERHVKTDQLPQARVELLPLDMDAENKRATTVEENFGKVAPGVVQYTTDALFRDLWLRPGLAPRDRSMVTVSALVASGQTAQITYHLNRAMDNGLAQEQAGEMLTQMAFYAGWPNVFSAMPVFKEVFAKRPGAAQSK
jgi:4-carboxymuconolactone decarboxylase